MFNDVIIAKSRPQPAIGVIERSEVPKTPAGKTAFETIAAVLDVKLSDQLRESTKDNPEAYLRALGAANANKLEVLHRIERYPQGAPEERAAAKEQLAKVAEIIANTPELAKLAQELGSANEIERRARIYRAAEGLKIPADLSGPKQEPK